MKHEREFWAMKRRGELVTHRSNGSNLPVIVATRGGVKNRPEYDDSCEPVRVKVIIEEIKERHRVYIAGPITKGDLFHNMKQATEAFLILMKAGFAPLCPHWSAYAGGPMEGVMQGEIERVPFAWAERLPAGTSHEDWIGVDLPWVSVAEAVLRLPGKSTGADKETALARELGIPVFESIDELTRHFNN